MLVGITGAPTTHLSLSDGYAELEKRVAHHRTLDDLLLGIVPALHDAPGPYLAMLAWWENDAPHIAVVEPLDENGTRRQKFRKLRKQHHRDGARGFYFWPLGDVVHIERLLDPAAIPYSSLTLADAVEVSRVAMQANIDMQRLEASEAFIGGTVATGVVDASGARIIAKPELVVKDYGSAALAKAA